MYQVISVMTLIKVKLCELLQFLIAHKSLWTFLYETADVNKGLKNLRLRVSYKNVRNSLEMTRLIIEFNCKF